MIQYDIKYEMDIKTANNASEKNNSEIIRI